MSQEQLVVNGALVCCTMTEKPSGDKLGDTENYKIYRIVHLGNTNNGAFGLDEAFLTEYDAGAELYIEPFPVCRSPYYARALWDIAAYLQGLKRASADVNEQARIEDRCQLLRQLAQAAVDREQIVRGDWRGQCVMELLDQWFNCSNTLYIDDLMQRLERLKGDLDGIYYGMDRLADQVLQAAEEAMGEDLKLARMIRQCGVQAISLPEDTQVSFEVKDLKGVRKCSYLGRTDQKKSSQVFLDEGKKMLTYEEALSLLDGYERIRHKLFRRYKLKYDLRKRLHAVNLRYALEIHDEMGNGVYRRTDKYVDEEGDRLEGEISGIWLRIQEEVKALDGEDIRHTIKKYGLGVPYQSYRDYMEGVSDKIHELLRKASRIREDLAEQALVTTDSYLMCRCGGRIEVLSSGQWVEEVDSKVDEHIVEILQFAEENIYGLMQTYGAYADTPDTEDYANSRYSTLIALNGIYALLRSMGKEGKYDAIKDMEEVRKKYPLPNISIDLVPQNEVEAMEAKKAIVREATGDLPLGLKWFFKVLFFMEDRSNRFENEGENVKKVAEGEVENGDRERVVGTVEMIEDATGDIASVTEEVLEKNLELQKKYKKLKNVAGKINKINDSDLMKAKNTIMSAVTWCQLLQDFMAKSYAIFIGKITIEINTGWDKYTYEANYDGEGGLVGDILYRKSYLGRDMFTNLGMAHFYDDGSPYMFGIYEGDGTK